MNVQDTLAPEHPKTWAGMLRMIFARQAELMEKYRSIEGLPHAPVSLHLAAGQKILKDFAWRMTEELTESYEGWFKHNDRADAEVHALEELADAVHFFVELCIFAGIDADMCITRLATFPPARNSRPAWSSGYWQVVFKLGVAMNFLRNKAWKQSQVPTDVNRFQIALLDTYETLFMLWADLGYAQEHVFDYYMRKAAVNTFRQRTKY